MCYILKYFTHIHKRVYTLQFLKFKLDKLVPTRIYIDAKCAIY